MINLPEVGTLWKHRNGGVYKVVCLANAHSTSQSNYPTTVVYEGLVNNRIWARKAVDWDRSMTQTKDNN